jgi:hypothetical protein
LSLILALNATVVNPISLFVWMQGLVDTPENDIRV